MVHIERHIAVSAGWIAGPAFGVAMMAAPEYLHPSHTSSALLFWGGLGVFFLTLLVVFILSAEEIGRSSRKLGPLITIAIGLAIAGIGTAWYFWPNPERLRTGPTDQTQPSATARSTQAPGTEAPILTPLQSEPKILLKRYNAADRARLDEALYKIFDIITVIQMPLQREAEYNLVHNWESKMLSPTQGPTYFTSEIDRIRKEATAGHQQIYNLIYKDYNYYMEELRDAAMESRTTNFFATLDALRSVLNALPSNPTMDQLRVLVADKHKAFAQGIEEYGSWMGDARRRIQQKRDYILTLQGSP